MLRMAPGGYAHASSDSDFRALVSAVMGSYTFTVGEQPEKPRPSDCDRAVELGLIRTITQLVHLIVESLVNILDGSAKKCVDVYRGSITKELEDDFN